ncbi:MAG: energy-coupling factor ABC transporter ATP-binding protein [Pseudothermotoga sp.]
MLQVVNLSFQYKIDKALDQVNLAVHDGDFLLLTGANGSGKTTLLKILAGLLPVQSGEILFDGRVLSQNDLRMLCGYVFHNPVNQIIGSTLEEDVAFGLENMGVPRSKMHEQVTEILEIFQLSQLKNEDPMSLSAGQAQKLAIASVAVLKPKYLLLDEPTSMLDDLGCRQVNQVLRALNQMGMSIVISTHEIYQFTDLARRVIHLCRGTVDFDGSINEFIDSPIDDVEK